MFISFFFESRSIVHLKCSSILLFPWNRTFDAFHWFRIFRIRCSKCNTTIQSNETIMKTAGQVFHLDCFRCSLCHDHLNKGDPYMFRNGLLLCHADFPRDLQHQQQQQNIASHHPPHSTMRCNRSLFYQSKNSDSIEFDWHFRLGDEEDSYEDECCSSDTMIVNTGVNPHGHNHPRLGRGPKRPRTILTSLQRRKFKQAFDISSKPCRKVTNHWLVQLRKINDWLCLPFRCEKVLREKQVYRCA